MNKKALTFILTAGLSASWLCSLFNCAGTELKRDVTVYANNTRIKLESKPLKDSLLYAEFSEQAYKLPKTGGKFRVKSEIEDRGWRYLGAFPAKALNGQEQEFGFVAEKDGTVVVAFRGTRTQKEWQADSLMLQSAFSPMMGPGMVHTGFLQIYLSCRDKILGLLRKAGSRKKLVITGHSLGSGVAFLFALEAAYLNKERVLFKDISVFAFAAPRTGDPAFVDAYNRLIPRSFRVINHCDRIQNIPPKQFPAGRVIWQYRHVHTGYLIRVSGTVDEHKCHDIETYINALKRLK